jgi:hypothetical protein
MLCFDSEKAVPKRRRKPALNATSFRLQPHQLNLKDWEVHDDIKLFASTTVRLLTSCNADIDDADISCRRTAGRPQRAVL